MLKLNSMTNDLFEVKNENDAKFRSCGRALSRNDIVSVGRLVACEYMGNQFNALNDMRKVAGNKFESRMNSMGTDYASLAKDFADNRYLFCATVAYKARGIDEVKSLEDVKRDMTLARDPNFMNAMAAIDAEVLEPLLFRVFDDISGNMLQWETAPLGSTKEITVQSNDAFLFEDSSWGSGHSTSKNYLYAQTITLTPKMKTANATIKWYQNIVNGDPGWYYGAIMRGMWSKIYAMFVGGLKKAAAQTKYMPDALKATTYTTQNFLKVSQNVAAANGLLRSDLVAYGSAVALNNIVPQDTQGAILGMSYGLGEQWFYNGYLPRVGQVALVEALPVVVPGTQNTTVQTIFPDDVIYIAARGGRGYAPMFGVRAEGSPITITATPSGGNGMAQGTADFTIDINVGAVFDIAPVFATKVGQITLD